MIYKVDCILDYVNVLHNARCTTSHNGLPQSCLESRIGKVVKPSCSQCIKYAVLEQDYRNTQVRPDQAMLLGFCTIADIPLLSSCFGPAYNMIVRCVDIVVNGLYVRTLCTTSDVHVKSGYTLIPALQIDFACLQTQSTTELNQKLTKIMPRRRSLQDSYT